MWERLRQAYLKKWKAEVRKRVEAQPWNAEHNRRMRLAGEKFKARHPELYRKE